MNAHDMLNLSYDFRGERTKLEYGRARAHGCGIDGIDENSQSWVYLVRVTGGHRIAEDGGLSTGTPASSGPKAKGKGKW